MSSPETTALEKKVAALENKINVMSGELATLKQTVRRLVPPGPQPRTKPPINGRRIKIKQRT